MRGLLIPLLLTLAACASPPAVTLSASANQTFNTSWEQSRLRIESKTVAIYLAPCADDVCGTVVIAPGARFHFADPMVAVTDLNRRPLAGRVLDASDSETDLSVGSNSDSSGWSLQGKRPRPGKRQNFIIRLEKAQSADMVLQLPDVEIDGHQAQLPAVFRQGQL